MFSEKVWRIFTNQPMLLLLKKIQHFLLLIIIAVPLILGAFFGIKQKIVQWHMQSEAESVSVETITVSLTDFKWVSLNKEATVRGRLFDVKQYKINSATITLTGFYDEKEEDLANQASKIITEGGKKQNTSGNPVLLKLLFQQLYYCNINFNCNPGSFSVYKQFVPLNESITTTYLSGIMQPPRQFPC